MKHCKKLFALLAAALLCMALTLPAGAAAPLVRDECGAGSYTHRTLPTKLDV